MAEHFTENYSVSVTENQKVLKTVSLKRDNDKVDRIANLLVDKLDNPERRAYYCKVAWKLSEAQIWSNLEVALKGRSPQKYFTFLCQRQMK